MKKITFIFLIVIGLFVFNITQASAGCNIVWSGYLSDDYYQGPVNGSIPTNETSRTQQAAQELFAVLYDSYRHNCLCGSVTASFTNNCYSYSTSQLYLCTNRGSVCTSGTWGFYCEVRDCMWAGCVDYYGTWDVICDGSTTTTTVQQTTTTTIPQSTTTTTAPATFIDLSSFSAVPKFSKVIIQWSTEAETDNAGFNLYRSESESGEYVKINDALIPAQGTSTQGSSYEFTDNNVQNRKTYYYKLEDIDLSGKSTMHGPVSAAPRWMLGIFGKFGK